MLQAARKAQGQNRRGSTGIRKVQQENTNQLCPPLTNALRHIVLQNKFYLSPSNSLLNNNVTTTTTTTHSALPPKIYSSNYRGT